LDLVKERLYYTIGEVSSILGLNPSTIRYWEKYFSALKPSKRTGTSKRKFDLNDIQTLFRIRTLLKDEKSSIRKAQAILSDWKPDMNPDDFIRSVNESKRPKLILNAGKCDRIKKIVSEIRTYLGKIQ